VLSVAICKRSLNEKLYLHDMYKFREQYKRMLHISSLQYHTLFQ